MTVAAAPTTQADRKALWTFLRFVLGLALLGGLAYFLWTPGDWANKLFVWVLLTILADECAGWFGYIGLALGALVLLAPGATPEQWFVALPLIGAALFALLLLKHAGGPFVLPFAALIFAGAVLGADRVGHSLDTPIKLLGTAEFRRMALLPMVIGVAVSFVRQLVALLLRWQTQRRTARPVAAAPASAGGPAPADPATPAVTPPATATATGVKTEVIAADPASATAPAPASQTPAKQTPAKQTPAKQTPAKPK